MPVIEVEDLRKNYGAFKALLGISFQVDQGEVLGFLGPNGAGKTTTMKILTGFLNPSGGRASIGGHDVVESSLEARRLIGYLPENTPLYEDMTVRAYLRFCGKLRGMGGSHLRQRMRRVVGIAGLEPKYRAPIKTLSKGYRQRVGIAQALLHEPGIIILDEPTVGLDPNQVVEVRSLIGEMGRRRTVILCSHILSEVEAVCGRVVIIHEGQIVGNGSPEELAGRLDVDRFYDISVRGDGDMLLQALGAVDGVTNASLVRQAGPVAEARFEARDDGTASGAAASLVSGGLELLSLVPRRASLEDVFRTVTGAREAVHS